MSEARSAVMRLVDASWEVSQISLASGPVDAFMKRFHNFQDARPFCMQHLMFVYQNSGAIFVGEHSEPTPITTKEIDRLAELGLPLPPSEDYEDVLLIGQIDFESLLGFLDVLHFGRICRKASDEEARNSAKELIRRIQKNAPFAISTINDICINASFMRPVSQDMFHSIFDDIWKYNCAYFPVQLSRAMWMRSFRQANGFTLGPC